MTFAVKETKLIKKSFKIDPHESFRMLEKLEEFFKKHRKPNNKIQKIYVCKGPGSYTGVRIGVTIAQALGFAWHIPVKAVSKAQMDKLLI